MFYLARYGVLARFKGFLIICTVLVSSFVVARELVASDLAAIDKEAGIYLQKADKSETRIGTVTFGPATEGKRSARVEMDHSKFSEHFLSMRPFRCIEDTTEWFCYLEYPYELRYVVDDEDLSDLEYQLLFIRKTPGEFGIDAWNGLYYKLEVGSDASIVGRLFEGDLNVLQSPPEESYAKPVDLNEFIPGSVSARLFPTLSIR